MKLRQSARLDTAHQVQAFLDENATLIGPNIASARRNFDDAVTQLTMMAVTRTGGVIAARGATARQRARRSTLRNAHMKAIAQVAKIALPDVPEISQLVVTTKHLSGAALVAAAQKHGRPRSRTRARSRRTACMRAQGQRVRTPLELINALVVPARHGRHPVVEVEGRARDRSSDADARRCRRPRRQR